MELDPGSFLEAVGKVHVPLVVNLEPIQILLCAKEVRGEEGVEINGMIY